MMFSRQKEIKLSGLILEWILLYCDGKTRKKREKTHASTRNRQIQQAE